MPRYLLAKVLTGCLTAFGACQGAARAVEIVSQETLEVLNPSLESGQDIAWARWVDPLPSPVPNPLAQKPRMAQKDQNPNAKAQTEVPLRPSLFLGDVPTEDLLRSRQTFKAIVGQTLSKESLHPQYSGTLFQKQTPQVAQTQGLEKSFFEKQGLKPLTFQELDPLKTYEMKDGYFFEAKPMTRNVATPLKIRVSFASSSAKTDGNGPVAQPKTPASEAKTPTKPAESPASRVAFQPQAASASWSHGWAEAAGTRLRGHIAAPHAVAGVKVRLAGTSWEATADAEGFFSFAGLPPSGDMKLLVWDPAGRLTRAIVPVHLPLKLGGVVEVKLEDWASEMTPIWEASQGFDSSKGGFCATLKGSEATWLQLAQAQLESENAGHLFELPNANGKTFCVTDAAQARTALRVTLPGGWSRRFEADTPKGFFSTRLQWDVRKARWAKVTLKEPLDARDALSTLLQVSEKVDMGSGGTRQWTFGGDSPLWAPVKSSEAPHAWGVAAAASAEAPVFIPLGQESTRLQTSPHSHVVLASETVAPSLNEGMFQGPDSGSALALPVLPDTTLADFLRFAPGHTPIAKDMAKAFVELDLGAMGIEADEARVEVHDSLTGALLGHWEKVPAAEGSARPLWLRGFVFNLPAGRHVLVVKNAWGALKGLAEIEADPQSMQILRVGSTPQW